MMCNHKKLKLNKTGYVLSTDIFKKGLHLRSTQREGQMDMCLILLHHKGTGIMSSYKTCEEQSHSIQCI